MFKILISLLFALLLANSASAVVSFKWLSVTSMVVEDEHTRIMFDPMFTRATLKHWLNLSDFRSDEKLVQEVLKEQNLQKIDALFISHSHFDHSIDAPMVAKHSGALLYVDKNSEIIAKAYKDPQIKTQLFTNLEPIKIGAFTVRPIKRQHSHIKPFGFEFLPGPVPADFNFGFYDYKVGDTWFYVIEHPSGTIVIDQAGDHWVHELKGKALNADVLIHGVANRTSDETLMAGYIDYLKPKIFIPVHFDNFFFSFNRGEPEFIPGVKIDVLMGKLKKNYPMMKLIMPKYGMKEVLLK